MAKKPEFYNGTIQKIYKLVSLVMVVIILGSFIVQILFSKHVFKTNDDEFWEHTIKRISATAVVVLMLMNQPHYIMMVWVGINTIIKPYSHQHTTELSENPPDYYSDSEPVISQPTQSTSLKTQGGRKEWLKLHYPWVDIYKNMYRNFGPRYASRRSIFAFMILALVFNAGCVIQYIICATVAWVPKMLISNGAYSTLQTLSIVTQIVPSIIAGIIWKRYQKELAAGNLFPWA